MTSRVALSTRLTEAVEALPIQMGNTAVRLGPGALGLLLGLFIWHLGAVAYGPFVLPTPLATAKAVASVLSSVDGWAAVLSTIVRVISGLAISLTIGAGLGIAAGYVPFLLRMLMPWATILLGMPAIAWIILTMIWFGPSHGAVIFTVSVMTTPVLFMGAAEGVLVRDRRLDDMALGFGASAWQQFLRVGLFQIAGHLAPVMAIALALGFKVAIMSELITSVTGIGGELALARTHLDVDMAMAWVVLAVSGLLAVEHTAVRPLRRRLERWRAIGRG
ncbi:ABC transporter permease subunit [Mesobacterium sp. TK19101]|uniref:ABC transporter permease subunit n=1 Tax=Mesobacterium hydrothermale TaxID=3111907 RepID=A0ABU6HGH9_9RHOB|nr:ABC transporter permease subunit [Mesobacterium sp. TK19101]MEC3860950.1 ABC transporter permease subunit [Mesobacterium sp. TK19101]